MSGSKPVYSIGARLIDEEGKAELCRIQILDDTITIAQSVECKKNVVCRGNVSVTKTITASNNDVVVTGSADFSSDIPLPRELYLTHATANGLYTQSDKIVFNGNNGQTHFEDSLKIETQDIIVTTPTIHFAKTDGTKILGTDGSNTTFLPSFLYNHDAVGSLWILVCKTQSTLSSMIEPGTFLRCISSTWYLGSTSLSYVRKGGFWIDGNFLRIREFGSVTTSYQFRTLMYFANINSAVVLVVRTA